MTISYICDRCGNRLGDYVGRVDGSLNWREGASARKALVAHDLCENCSDELAKFLKLDGAT